MAWKVIKTIIIVLCIVFVLMYVTAKAKKGKSIYKDEPKQQNPLEGKKVIFVENKDEAENADGVRGHLEAVGESDYRPTFYSRYIKRILDIILSFAGLILLSPVFAIIALAIFFYTFVYEATKRERAGEWEVRRPRFTLGAKFILCGDKIYFFRGHSCCRGHAIV